MTLDSVREAHERIRTHIHRTPVLTSRLLNAQIGAELYFKAENLQKVGAFKARGALNAVLGLNSSVLKRGLVTHSSGNHGAALAYAGQIAGAPIHVVMPEDSLPNKIEAVRGYGADLTLCDPAERESTADRILHETGGTLIHPYDDDRIIAGQGTTALEFLEQEPDLEILMTPIGGGGLLGGCSLVAKSMNPSIRVIGAEPAKSDDAYQSWKTGQLTAPTDLSTIADGLRAGIGTRNFALLQAHVNEVLLVSEEAIIAETKRLMHYLKTVVEPSAAVPMAAVAEHPETFAGKRVGIILSGGNFDFDHPPWLESD